MPVRATLADVARKVGVSAKSVSRVVNGEPNVSARLREAVEKAVLELDYRPNLAARSLASSQSRIIGVINPQIDSSYFSSINTHFINACRTHGHHLIIEQIDKNAPEAAAQVREFLREVDFAGLVLTPGAADSQEICELVAATGAPFVSIAPMERPAGQNAIMIDDQQGEIALADHLWSLGHRTFAIMIVPADIKHSRGQASERRLLELGCDPKAITRFEFDYHLPDLEAGRRIAAKITQRGNRFDALCAFNDELAAGAIGHFLTKGMSVPGDISVVGFDDSPIACSIWPQLTTIRQPIDIVANTAIEMLVGREPSTPKGIVTCPVELIVRHSTGPRRTG